MIAENLLVLVDFSGSVRTQKWISEATPTSDTGQLDTQLTHLSTEEFQKHFCEQKYRPLVWLTFAMCWNVHKFQSVLQQPISKFVSPIINYCEAPGQSAGRELVLSLLRWARTVRGETRGHVRCSLSASSSSACWTSPAPPSSRPAGERVTDGARARSASTRSTRRPRPWWWPRPPSPGCPPSPGLA